MADKNFNTVSVVNAVNDTDTLHITTGGTHARVSVDTLIAKAKAQTLTEIEAALLDKLTDGCFVMYHNQSANYPYTTAASGWATKQSTGNIADGVLVISGDKHIVVAPTESSKTLKWSSSNILVNSSATVTSFSKCFSDFSGKTKTSAILQNGTIGSDGGDYAPGYCATYSRSNGVDYSATGHPEYGNYGLNAGTWWLPSIGELLLIMQNRIKINMLLSLITGATKINSDVYWSSSEYSQSLAWVLNIPNGYISSSFTKSYSATVRPVTEFIQ